MMGSTFSAIFSNWESIQKIGDQNKKRILEYMIGTLSPVFFSLMLIFTVEVSDLFAEMVERWRYGVVIPVAAFYGWFFVFVARTKRDRDNQN